MMHWRARARMQWPSDSAGCVRDRNYSCLCVVHVTTVSVQNVSFARMPFAANRRPCPHQRRE